MPKFKCENIRCTKSEVIITVSKVRWIFDTIQNKLVVKDKLYCEECKSELVFVKQEGEIKCNLLRFDSMNPEQKRQSLMKRNRKHYEKFEKRDVEERKRQILKDNRNQFGLK